KDDPPAKKELPAAKKELPAADGPKEGRIAFAGRVVDPDGKAVQGAKLYLLAPEYYLVELRPESNQRATTDAYGRFRFEEPPPQIPDLWRSMRPQIVAVADGLGLAMFPATVEGTTDAVVR